MTARRAAALVLALALATSGCEGGGGLGFEEPTPRAGLADRLSELGRPHLVLVVVDTLRADWTTPYGDPQGTTPELARWAEQGVVFERALAQSSWTKISMASLMTSLWPRSHGIREARDALAEGAVTLPELLGEAGYASHAVQTNGWLHASFGFHQGFERYSFPRGGGTGKLPRPSVWSHADRVVAEAGRLIEAHDPDRPLFLYLHFMDVHEYAAPTEFKRYGTDSEGAYRAAIAWVDDAVRRVREQLDRAGLLDRTILVLGSDHGETFGEHGVHGHARNVLTPVIHVPLVVRWPFRAEPVRVTSQVRNLDLAPTLLELAGVPIPGHFEGRSLLPLATGAEPEQDRPSFAGLGQPLFRDAAIQVALNDGRWTFARNLPPGPAPGELLFDRRVDPEENVDLLEHETAEAERLRGVLDAYLDQAPAPDVLASDVRIDPSIAERLRAMGYLDDATP